MMFKRFIIFIFIISASFTEASSQLVEKRATIETFPEEEAIPIYAIKTNMLSDISGSLNVAGEVRLSPELTLELGVSYNPWTFSDNKKNKHFIVQPEVRYWFQESFNGHFVGSHLLFACYNAGNVSTPLDMLPELKNFRHDGHAYGVGFSYGYQWVLSPRWSMETTIGFGYAYADYIKYEYKAGGENLGRGYKHYFGTTKLGVSLIYVL